MFQSLFIFCPFLPAFALKRVNKDQVNYSDFIGSKEEISKNLLGGSNNSNTLHNVEQEWEQGRKNTKVPNSFLEQSF